MTEIPTVVARPGDTVLLPVADRITQDYADKLRRTLEARAPDVQWGIMAPSSLTHAVVVRRGELPPVDELDDATPIHDQVAFDIKRAEFIRANRDMPLKFLTGAEFRRQLFDHFGGPR